MRISIIVTIFVLVVSRTKGISAAGYLGCRFSQSVCEEDELCGEDDLFGQCMKTGDGSGYYYSIDKAGYRLLRKTLSSLLSENYTWTDEYTQAILEQLLKPYRRISYKSEANVKENDETSVSETSVLTEEQIAELENLYQEYENLQNKEANIRENYVQDVDSKEYGEVQDDDAGTWESLLRQYLDSVLRSEDVGKDTREQLLDKYFAEYYELLDGEEDLAGGEAAEGSEIEEEASDENLEKNGVGEQEMNDWDTIQKLQMMRDYLAELYNREMTKQDRDALEKEFSYIGDRGEDDVGETTGYLEGDETVEKDDIGDDGDQTEAADGFGDIVENEVSQESYGSENNLKESDVRITSEDIDAFIDSLENPGKNLAYLSDEDIEELRNLIREILDELRENLPTGELDEKEEPVFQDSKSPDSGLNLAVDVLGQPLEKKSLPVSSETSPEEEAPDLVTEATNEDDAVSEELVQSTLMDGERSTITSGDAPELVQDLLIDTDYAFVTTAEILTEDSVRKLIDQLAKITQLPVETFSDISVSQHQVSFRVNPNEKNMTASDIDGEAAKHKDDIKDTTGLSITSTGIGNQSHVEVVEHLPSHTPSYVVLTFILTGCVAGILIAVLIIYVLKKQSKQKAKLQNLTSAPPTDQPTTADYQDLCRQRMASKSSEKPEPLHRIGSLGSHYSDAPVPSPSSRSSTSSWSEEPVHPNMDISTGHVVLSYMEDHLKNKDRLAKEWEGLCQYEAEPNSTNTGSDPSNSKKNRYPDILPYDHSRVMLNDSTNAAGSDYINANTITDHDPRSPAYIATQGPLPNTVADFWQMVWEQGCMVIVNLTQNMDDKDRVMCHPYWPEEGSQLYHIYEVHLVSEHIWCDDYLVRSFYLKNLQTNETRTVTQFHYLTWPDMGEPSSPKVLLEFRRKVNKSFRGRACPIVVHCSDGCGRTGTYCLIDMVLNRMTKGAKEIDIAATLEHIRDQRMQMVKTRDQFDFALKSVAEEVNAILKALPQ